MKPVLLFVELKISAKNKYICEIAEKLYDSGLTVCIFSPQDTVRIDNLLWTWKQESFVPHSVVNPSVENSTTDPVVICSTPESLVSREALILQSPLPEEFLLNYKLIFDFAEVFHSEKVEESRKRYKQFRSSEKFDVHFSQLGAILAKKSISLNFTS